ncbi:MAG TPA: CpaF/VirB11 family protein, partial [Burkholderiaceae bacterium]|nr:CpaF/VirB11 family protein [Burkholderiaceae bacterium]
RDLVRNALRMRPDRIIVGECRGGEALDMLQAMNSGHEGSLTTAHANSARDLLSRLEVMVLMAGMDLPLTAIRAQIAGALDLVVHQARCAGGARRITSIVEIVGCDSGIVQTQELFHCDANGVHHACGQIPSCLERLRAGGGLADSSVCFERPVGGGLRCT